MEDHPALNSVRASIVVPCDIDEMLELFESGDPSWLTGFLGLATLRRAGRRLGATWFRLGPIVRLDRRLDAGLTWCPGVDGVFSAFDGDFNITPTPDGTTLTLSGHTTRGGRDLDTAIINDVVAFIGQAVSHRQRGHSPPPPFEPGAPRTGRRE